MNNELSHRRAVIDVGTNSVKLLVADVAGLLITPVSEESNQTRLGAGFYATRQLQSAAIAKTAGAVAIYLARAAQLGASSVRVIATSAARDALNSDQLVSAIRQASGLKMEILTGDQEADWVFRGVASDPKFAQAPVLVLDVGGGSTEFIVGENTLPWYCVSYPLGTVRLLEQSKPADPPGPDALAGCRAFLKSYLDQQVAPALELALRRCTRQAQLVGTSGTAAILARMEAQALDFNRRQIESTVLPLSRVRQMLEQLWQLPLASRRNIPGLPPDRADVIATGIAIYEAIMERFGFLRLEISTRGLRYWALLEP
ncbi:MAG: Ppx/GppA phosphatase family protein [Verrucomicrobiota bacterium]|jgi:exopolyphosphatase/guanosine-5'-triphosphate,3'-diphosphate pyrophosphatase